MPSQPYSVTVGPFSRDNEEFRRTPGFFSATKSTWEIQPFYPSNRVSTAHSSIQHLQTDLFLITRCGDGSAEENLQGGQTHPTRTCRFAQVLNKLKKVWGGISIKEKIILRKTDNGVWKCKNCCGYLYLPFYVCRWQRRYILF